MLGRGYGREIDKTTAVRATANRFSGWRTNYPRAFPGGRRGHPCGYLQAADTTTAKELPIPAPALLVSCINSVHYTLSGSLQRKFADYDFLGTKFASFTLARICRSMN